MKERYEKPELEIIELNSSDIITDSNCPEFNDLPPVCVIGG